MTTAEDTTNAALADERTDWRTRLDNKDQTIAERDATITALQADLAACEASKPPTGGGGVSKRLTLSAVQVFPHRQDFPLYVDYPRVLAALEELGIKRVRGQCGPGTSATAMGFYKTAYDKYGIKAMLTIGEPRIVLTDTQWAKIEKDLTTLGASAIDSIYGWNEPNSVRGGGSLPANWATMTANHQKRLAILGTKIGALVGTCAPWSGAIDATWTAMAQVRQAGMTKNDYDIIAYHQYPRNNDTPEEVAAFYGKTETELRRVLDDQDSPFACTEYGWSTAPNAGTSGAVRLTEAERAKRLPLVADYMVSHGNRHSLFELLNTEDPTGADREDWLGIIHADWARTPAFVAYKNFLAGA